MAKKVDGNWYDSREFLHSDDAMPVLGTRSPDPVHGSARLATEAELEPWLREQPGRNPGLCFPGVSPLVDDPKSRNGCRPLYRRDLHLIEDEALRHMLAIGQTGCGKSTRFILPAFTTAVEHPTASVVVLCAKGDQLKPIYAFAARSGKRVRTLNLSISGRSAAWNPAHGMKSEGDAMRIAHAICWALPTSNSHENPFWIENSVQLIAGMLEAEACDPGGRATLPRVRELLGQPLDKLLDYCKAHEDVPSLENFQHFLRTGSHNAETVLSDARMRMRVYSDPSICAVTDGHELDFDELFGDEPTVLIVEMDETRLGVHRPIWNLLLTGLLDRAIECADQSPGGRLRRPLYVLIDEFASSVGRIPEFEVRLNTLRSRRVGVIAAVQSLGQLRHVYGDGAPAILAGFSTKVFLAGLERDDAEYASRLAGTTTIEGRVHRQIMHKDRKEPTVSVETHLVARRLLTPDDIAMPPEHFEMGLPATWFLPGMRPIQAWMTPCYEMPGYDALLREAPDALPRDPCRAKGPLVYRHARSWTVTPQFPFVAADCDNDAEDAPEDGREDAAVDLDEAVELVLAPGVDPEAVDLEERMRDATRSIRAESLAWDDARPSAQAFWVALERNHPPSELLRVAKALRRNQRTIEQYFKAYTLSNVECLVANLHYLDYLIIRDAEQKRGREALEGDREEDDGENAAW